MHEGMQYGQVKVKVRSISKLETRPFLTVITMGAGN